MQTIKNIRAPYQDEVIFSNLYFYLLEQQEKLTQQNIMGFIVTFVNRLKSWKNWGKEKGIDIMEHNFFKREDFELQENTHMDVVGLEVDFNKYFDEFVKTIPSYLDRCILRDFYDQKHVNTIDDLMSFYSVSKRQAYEIKKKIENLEFELFNYIKSKLCI
jgi:hypothetical protein